MPLMHSLFEVHWGYEVGMLAPEPPVESRYVVFIFLFFSDP